MELFDWDTAFEKTPQGFHDALTATLAALPERRAGRPARQLRRMALIAAAVAVLGCTGAYAAGQIVSWVSHSYAFQELHTLPDAAALKRDYNIGLCPVESFANGYVFTAARPVETSAVDADGNTAGTGKSLDIRYTGGSEKLSVCLTDDLSQCDAAMAQESEEYDGITIYAAGVDYKIVPPGYVMTEADKKAEENGTMVFACNGDKEVSTYRQQYVYWVQNDTACLFMAKDSSLTVQELYRMAEQMIDNN